MSRAVAEARPTERVLDELLDDGSFARIRSGVRSPALPDTAPGDGVLCGEGRLDGRRVFVFEQDPSVRGGSLGQAHAASICRVLDLADRFGSPVIGIHRSGGARIQEGVAALAGYGAIFSRHVRLQQRVPQIALVFGPCAGGAAYGPALMDFVVLPRHGAYLFLTGPDVVSEVTGEQVSLEDLGGSHVVGRSGLASLIGADESDCLALTRRLLSYLPDRIGDAPRTTLWQAPDADPSDAVPADPKATYDMRDVLAGVVDVDSFLELRAASGRSLVCGVARIEGRPIGIVANQPYHLAGSIDVDASRKGAWFVETCDRFGIPLAVFVDTPGFLPGTDQELGGVIPAGASFLAAFVRATVPKVTVVVRKAFGGAYIVMNAKDLGADYTYAWPDAEIAVLGAKGAVKILHRKRLAVASDPEALRASLESEYRDDYLSPRPAAEAGFIDEIIEPNQTRVRLARVLEGSDG